MKRLITLITLIIGMALAAPSQALDINLLNVNMGTPEGQRLANTYGQAYGYTPQQVAPAMYGPAQEVPTILRIAQAAGTVPMSVWMLRRSGMSFGKILSTFALGPSILTGGAPGGGMPYGYSSPGWAGFTDPFMVQMSRVYFLRNVLGVPTRALPYIPWGGANFSRSILYPYHPVHGTWMPPGIAKKYGLWVPPGQRKKIGWWPDQSYGGKHPEKWGYQSSKTYYPGGKEKIKIKGKGPHGKWEYKSEYKGGKNKVEFKSKGKGPGSKKKSVAKHGGNSSKSKGSHGPSSKGKGKKK